MFGDGEDLHQDEGENGLLCAGFFQPILGISRSLPSNADPSGLLFASFQLTDLEMGLQVRAS